RAEAAVFYLVPVLTSGGIVAVVLSAIGRPGLSWLRSAPLVWLGTVSYGLYLYHNILRNHFYSVEVRLGTIPMGYRFAILLGLSLLVSALSWLYVERPIIGLKRFVSYEPGHDYS